MKPEPTENVEVETQPEPVPIPYTEPDIPRDDSTPTIKSQAEASGFQADYYNFGRLEGKGVDYFNPGLVERPDGLWLLVRASEPHPQGFRFGQNSIFAFKTENEGKSPTMGLRLRWLVENQEQHFEDARGFYHAGTNQVFIGACSFLWYPDKTWTGAHQVFGSFDEEWKCKSVQYPEVGGNPGEMIQIKDRNNYEKNWLFFMHDNQLMLLYKAKPWLMVRFNGGWSQRTEFKHDGVNWAYGDVRGGTTPVRVGDHYFTFHHSSLPWKGKYRRYYAGCLAFDAKPPFTPRMITPEPLLRGSQQDDWSQRKPLVVFPCGSRYKDGKWLVTCGVNDMKSAWFEMHHQYLLSKMQPINQVECPIFYGDGLSEGEKQNLSGGVNQDSTVDRSCQPRDDLPVKHDDHQGSSLTAQTLLEKRRANAAKARAALAAKRAKYDATAKEAACIATYKIVDGKIVETPLEDLPPVIIGKTRKRRRRRKFKRVTAEQRQKALQQFHAQNKNVGNA